MVGSGVFGRNRVNAVESRCYESNSYPPFAKGAKDGPPGISASGSTTHFLVSYNVIEMKSTGKIYLVGAGPGDPELLTVKAHRLLAQADVVLHDDLVPEAVFAVAGPRAEGMNVG